MRIVAYVSAELQERFAKYIRSKYHDRHGAQSIVMEMALREYLDREEDKTNK